MKLMTNHMNAIIPKCDLNPWYNSLAGETLASYRKSIAEFCRFSGLSPEEFLRLDAGKANKQVLAWRSDLMQRYAPNSVNTRLTALRSLVRFGRLVGAVNWSLEVPNVYSQIYRDTRGPNIEEIKRMLEIASVRDKAIIWLLFAAALRKTELSSLEMDDLDLRGKRIMVRRKKRHNKEWITLSDQIIKAIDEWLGIRGKKPGSLFGVTPRTIHRIVRKLGQRIGIKTWPHALRHSAGTNAIIANNGNVRATQKLLGHASAVTTEAYLDNVRDDQGRMTKLLSSLIDQSANPE